MMTMIMMICPSWIVLMDGRGGIDFADAIVLQCRLSGPVSLGILLPRFRCAVVSLVALAELPIVVSAGGLDELLTIIPLIWWRSGEWAVRISGVGCLGGYYRLLTQRKLLFFRCLTWKYTTMMRRLAP